MTKKEEIFIIHEISNIGNLIKGLTSKIDTLTETLHKHEETIEEPIEVKKDSKDNIKLKVTKKK